jgi:REP element-mobilizing transposase RayT
MARKLRLQFEGAAYHVINRGNYRADVFGTEGAKVAFLKCLAEACAKAGWVVHAWCIMSNHFHLAVETPQANLVEGMRWLQTTFAVRFNRLRNESGHIFQGRYKALLVEPGALGSVCHYIHLNPVRAKLVTVATLPQWNWCSMGWVMWPKQRRPWFSPEAAFSHAGGLKDTPAGRRGYLEYLAWLAEDDAEKRRLNFERLSKGWVVGTRDFKQKIAKEHERFASALERGDAEDRAVCEAVWESRLQELLERKRKTAAQIQADAKGAEWKVTIAVAMKQRTTASNPWLAARLNMGSPWRLSRLASARERE